jgi:hypothetical protein
MQERYLIRPLLLNLEQRKLYDVVVDQYSRGLMLNKPPPLQLLLNVDGVAGSGKTFTLLKTFARIQELAEQAGKPRWVWSNSYSPCATSFS